MSDQEGKGFRIIDRRGGREEEKEKEAPAPSPGPPPAAAPTSPPPAASAVPPPAPAPPPADAGNRDAAAGVREGKGPGPSVPGIGGPTFLDLVMTLQMGALVSLGMVAGPDGRRPPLNLPAAKDSIDMLEVLQAKTKGNLTAEEDGVLREGLYHLRMAYVAAAGGGPPGPGGKGK